MEHLAAAGTSDSLTQVLAHDSGHTMAAPALLTVLDVPPPPLAEANAINENTDTLHLSPQINTEYVGQSSEKRPEVCERSCEELGSMINELSGLHVIVNQLHENLRKVVSARAAGPGGWADPLRPRVLRH